MAENNPLLLTPTDFIRYKCRLNMVKVKPLTAKSLRYSIVLTLTALIVYVFSMKRKKRIDHITHADSYYRPY